jgi:hypothetical protein
VTNFVTGMAAGKHLATWFLAIRNSVFARGARSKPGNAVQWCFPARATNHDIWGSRTMGRMRVLWMAILLAKMHTTVERPVTGFIAAETSGPLFLGSITAHCLTFHLILLGTTQHLGVHFSTITTSFYRDLAGTTQALVTWKRAGVFTTRKQVTTDLPTAPSLLIIGILATFGGGIPTAETILSWSHGCTRGTGSCVTSSIARMRTALTRP